MASDGPSTYPRQRQILPTDRAGNRVPSALGKHLRLADQAQAHPAAWEAYLLQQHDAGLARSLAMQQREEAGHDR